MKTETKNEAEIASDVRYAMRTRAETEHAEAIALKRESAKERRALERSRKEKLATFYYAISTLFATSSGIGGLTSFFINENKPVNWFGLVIGIVLTFFFAFLANRELKNG